MKWPMRACWASFRRERGRERHRPLRSRVPVPRQKGNGSREPGCEGTSRSGLRELKKWLLNQKLRVNLELTHKRILIFFTGHRN